MVERLDQQFPSPGEPDQYAIDGPAKEPGMTMFRVGAINTPSSREFCVIRALSSEGMRLKTFSDLTTGQWVSVEFKHGEAIEGQVTSCKGEMADVAFDQPIDVAAVMAADPEGPTPRMPRIDIACPATVREGAKLVRAKIIDISQGGVRVEGDGGCQSGRRSWCRSAGWSPNLRW